MSDTLRSCIIVEELLGYSVLIGIRQKGIIFLVFLKLLRQTFVFKI